MAPQTPAPVAASTHTDRTYLLERVDDAAVVQLYADGFSALPLRDRTLIWHLTQAAIAGRDIFYDQRYAHNLAMRDVLEALVRHFGQQERKGREGREGQKKEEQNPLRPLRSSVIDEIVRYTKLFWLNTGPYNNLTARKFVLRCTPQEFSDAA